MNMKDILNEFNTLGSDKKTAQKQLDENDKNQLIALYALTAVCLAYRYNEENQDPWDDRSKASKKYAFENRARFIELFQKYSGFTLPELLPGCVYLSKLVTPRNIGSTYMEWLHIVESEHPTILQSYFRGYTNVLMEELNLPDANFPFI